uniref:LRRC8 pannexin-like TM region domain-containing protein n=1 Tax=Ciona savignyi TaxID=51511 RepID=H2Z4M8_CIOSA
MGSSWAFKTTASLIKPTREALLDYCSYVLIVIALVGTARIIIGRKDLEQLCAGGNAIENKSIKEHNNYTRNASSTSFADQSKHGIDKGFKFESNLKVHISNQISKTIDIEEDSTSMPTPKHYCLKHYQAYLPYFLLVESIVLLLIGVLWVKMPAVQQLVKQFANILHECRQSTWYISVADVLRSPSTMPVTQSLFTLMKSDAVNMEIVLLLETLFRPESAYLNKSQARKLYEQVQKFCNETEKSTALLNSYMTKSLAQLISWMVFFFVNMVLFVKYEFYSGCNLSEPFCDHDTFLRIIWFLAQLIVLVYGIFNCSALKWLNDKAVAIDLSKRTCLCVKQDGGLMKKGEFFKCRP